LSVRQPYPAPTGSGSSPVDSVFGRTGDVVPVTDDYTWAQIDKTVSDIADINVRSHTSLTSIGTNTHAQLDTHVASTSNPHSVTAAQAGAVALTGNETVVGIKTFSSYPQGPGTSPTLSAQLVDKNYVDTFAQGVTFKEACRVATTTAGTLASSFENGDTIDGIVLATGNRILIKDQSTTSQNGIYTVNASGAPTRATDFDADAEVFAGATVTILFGTVNANSLWVQTAVDPVVGTDPITFTQLPAPDPITASNGVQRVGDDIQIDLSDTNPSLEVSDGGLRAKVDSSTINRSASGLVVGLITDSNVSGAIAANHGGTGLTALGSANQVLGVNSGASAAEYKSVVGGSNVTVTHSAGQIEISSSLSGSADFIYTDIAICATTQTVQTWTNMPAAETELFGNTLGRKVINLEGAVQYRIMINQSVAGFAGADLNLEYSTNGTTFLDADTAGAGEVDCGTGTGVKIGSWTNLVSGAKTAVWIRLVGKQGDGVVDPGFRQISVQFKYNSTIVSGSTSSYVYDEITIHSHPNSALIWTNLPAAVAEFPGNAFARQKADLSWATHYRIVLNQSVAGFAGSDLNVQYSTNNSTFVAADTAAAGETDCGTGTGVKVGAWAALVDGAKGDVWIRLVGKQGDGIVDPAWREVKIQFKGQVFSPTAGSDTQVIFNDGGTASGDSGFTFNKTTDFASLSGGLTLVNATQNINLFATGGVLNVQSQDSGEQSAAALWSKDGDGTDNVYYTIWGKGLPGAITDSESLLIGYISGSGWQIAGGATGAGTSRPIQLYTKDNFGQFNLNTNGSVGFFGDYTLSSVLVDNAPNPDSNILTLINNDTAQKVAALGIIPNVTDGTQTTALAILGYGVAPLDVDARMEGLMLIWSPDESKYIVGTIINDADVTSVARPLAIIAAPNVNTSEPGSGMQFNNDGTVFFGSTEVLSIDETIKTNAIGVPATSASVDIDLTALAGIIARPILTLDPTSANDLGDGILAIPLAIRTYKDEFNTPIVAGLGYGGTQASPTATENAQSLLYFAGLGFDGTDIAIGAWMEFITDEAWTPGNYATEIQFGMAEGGSVRFLPDGSVLSSGIVEATEVGGSQTINMSHDGSDALISTTMGNVIFSSGIEVTSIQCDSIVNDTGLAAGTYTPTRSAEANLDSNVTMTEAQYLRVGNTVTVSGAFTADPTTPATATSFEITLPISSNIAATNNVAGSAFCGAIAGQGAQIIGVIANDTAKISWIAGDVTSQIWSYMFTYKVI